MIAEEDFHRHSAYVLRHADMPGFNRAEQQTVANLALGQTGGLRKLRGLFADELGWLSVLALRIAVVVEAEHQCMTTRGVHKPGVGMVTSTMLGAFREDGSTRREFLAIIGK